MPDDAVYVNFPEGLKRMMNNPKLYTKLLTKFKEGTKLDPLEVAFSAGNLPETMSEVHTLKGIAANLSLSELASACLALEARGKEGVLDADRMGAVKAAFGTTLQEIDRVIAEHGQ